MISISLFWAISFIYHTVSTKQEVTYNNPTFELILNSNPGFLKVFASLIQKGKLAQY